MNHSDHVRLLQKGVATLGGVWADLGSGAGAFTLALADLLGPGGNIYAVDKDREVLGFLEKGMQIQFPATHLSIMQADFSRTLELPALDGVVMANSLHFVRRKDEVLQHVRSYLRPGGCLLLVEYNADRGNPWVPYPLSYPSWEKLAQRNGFSEVQLMERVPSRFLGEIYSALNR